MNLATLVAHNLKHPVKVRKRHCHAGLTTDRVCPACGKRQSKGYRACVRCRHEFFRPSIVAGRKSNIKACPGCAAVVGTVLRDCPKCSHVFADGVVRAT